MHLKSLFAKMAAILSRGEMCKCVQVVGQFITHYP